MFHVIDGNILFSNNRKFAAGRRRQNDDDDHHDHRAKNRRRSGGKEKSDGGRRAKLQTFELFLFKFPHYFTTTTTNHHLSAMKFKAKLTPQQTNLLHNLIHPISRLHPTSSSNSSTLTSSAPSTILYLDDEKLVLSTRGGSSNISTSNSILHNSIGGGGGLGPSSSSSNATYQYTQSNNDAEGIFCFAELFTKNGIFRDLIIQSLENDNAILMEINIVQFRMALKGVLNAQIKHLKERYGSSCGSGGSGGVGGANTSAMMNMSGIVGPELTIKLAKRNGGLPHLCLDVKDNKPSSQEIASLSIPNQNNATAILPSSSMIGVHHAIPVRMMRVEELQYHVPPQLGMPDVQLELPRDRPLKNVVDRLRMIHPHGELIALFFFSYVYIQGQVLCRD